MMYCIYCEKMVKALRTPEENLFHYVTIKISNDADPGSRWDLAECEFPCGASFCPPPEFDMDAFMERIKASVYDDYLSYDYDVETDQIMEVVL